MQLDTLPWCMLLAVVLHLVFIDGRPTDAAIAQAETQPPNGFTCKPNVNAKEVRHRVLCPFWLEKTALMNNITVEVAKRPNKCADQPCGKDNLGTCTPVKTMIKQSGLQRMAFTSAYVCAYPSKNVEPATTIPAPLDG